MDSNIPANALSYALLAAPAGAAIDGNGIITWTPMEAQGPSTNTITTVVTDNGVPPMSATNSFTVVVTGSAPALVIQSITVSNGIATIKWNSVSNLSYRLQYTADLADLIWSNIVPDITATGSVVTTTNGINNSTQRFYRVQVITLP
jgi:hypothetical protein